ncbi:MAG: hypothetical protein RIC55_29840 [Pirellulaceae bacterium]
MVGVFLTLGVLLLGQPAVEGQTPDEAALLMQAQLRRLVRQLDDDELAVREQAEEALIALGPSALDLLPDDETGLSAEVKQRLGRVRQTLEDLAVQSAIQATTVTLNGTMSLQDAVAAIAKQTGNNIAGVEDRPGEIAVQFDKTPFWPALDQVLDQAQLDINPYGGYGDRLTVTARPEEELGRYGRADYSGIFRFEAKSIQAVRNLRNPEISGLKLLLDIAWEPRTRPISLEQPLSDLQAIDENGDPLPVEGGGGELHANVQSDIPSVEMYLPFQLPARGVTKIASLKGKMTAMVPGRVETFEFDNLAMGKNVEKRRAGVTVVLEEARKNVDTYEVRLRIKFDEAANALESHRDWIFRNKTYLVDREGKRVDVATLNTTRQDVNEVGLAFIYVLDKGLENYKLVYQTPAAILKKPIEFELKDIPLP